MLCIIQFWDEGETPPSRPQQTLLELSEDRDERQEKMAQHFVETCGYDKEGLNEEELEELEFNLSYSEDHDGTCDYQVQDDCGRHMFATIVELPIQEMRVALLCSCGEGDCTPGYLMCPECIARDDNDNNDTDNHN